MACLPGVCGFDARRPRYLVGMDNAPASRGGGQVDPRQPRGRDGMRDDPRVALGVIGLGVIGVAAIATGTISLVSGRDEALLVGGTAIMVGLGSLVLALLVYIGQVTTRAAIEICILAGFLTIAGTSLIEPLVWNDRWWMALGYLMVIFIAGAAALRNPLSFGIFLGVSTGAWVVALALDENNPVPMEDALTLLLLASIVATAIFLLLRRERHNNRLLTEQLRHSATRDVLTGLLNRAGIAALMSERPGPNNPVANADWCAFIDVDKFKAINDNRGHEAGDRVLRDCADSIWLVTRPTDIVARWGGDEFVIFGRGQVPREEDLEARIGIEVLRRAVLQGYDDPLSSPVTVTVGVAGRDQSSDPKVMVREADLRMYQRRTNSHEWQRL